METYQVFENCLTTTHCQLPTDMVVVFVAADRKCVHVQIRWIAASPRARGGERETFTARIDLSKVSQNQEAARRRPSFTALNAGFALADHRRIRVGHRHRLAG